MSEVAKPAQFTPSSKIKTMSAIFMFIGLVAFIVTLVNDKERAWHGYLTGMFYFASIAVGGLFFTAIQHATKAGWSVNVRRFCEALTAYLPYAFVFVVILICGAVFGDAKLYSWMNPEYVAKDHLLQHKAPYLNTPFFIVRTLLFFGLWVMFAKWMVGRSLKQDETGDVNITHSLVPLGVSFLVVFALSYSLFAVDTLMSLEPHWFSTIFGVYAFAGLFQSTMAVMIITIVYLSKKGLLTGYVNENHLHDLGKFLFAFTVFWAYIAFSQHMLIWYANLPEETIFFEPRSHGSWVWVSVSLIIFKFIVPFLFLLPRWAKRTPAHLVMVSILILVMQYVDIYWLVYPNLSEEKVIFGLSEIGIFLGFLGVFMMAVVKFLSTNSLIPYKDPRIHESMSHVVTY